MTNRVTNQVTQNGLIEKFQLKGVMPEMDVAPTIIPVVQVATLSDALNISEFEKWRSVFSLDKEFIQPNDLTFSANPFIAATHNIPATSNHIGGHGTCNIGGFFGCKIPGAGVGVPATDGIYKITVRALGSGVTEQGLLLRLIETPAYGPAVAAGTARKRIGVSTISPQNSGPGLVFDMFLPILATDLANAVRIDTLANSVNGACMIQLSCQKLIDEIPPFVIF